VFQVNWSDQDSQTKAPDPEKQDWNNGDMQNQVLLNK